MERCEFALGTRYLPMSADAHQTYVSAASCVCAFSIVRKAVRHPAPVNNLFPPSLYLFGLNCCCCWSEHVHASDIFRRRCLGINIFASDRPGGGINSFVVPSHSSCSASRSKPLTRVRFPFAGAAHLRRHVANAVSPPVNENERCKDNLLGTRDDCAKFDRFDINSILVDS